MIEFLKKIQSDEIYKSFDEASIKQGIVLKILSLLEWDPFNIAEIRPEYDTGYGKVNFLLQHNNKNIAFLDVKVVSGDYQNIQERLVEKSFQCEIKIAILTNGFTWWFFLPFFEGSLEEKRFQIIEINEQNLDDVAQSLHGFLSKKKINSGETLKTAEDICLNRKKLILINEQLPKAWLKIMYEPEKWLVDIISQVTKDLCGYKPDRETVIKFIKSYVKKEPDKQPESLEKKQVEVLKEDHKGKSINSFAFMGKKYNVKSWKAMLLKICHIMFQSHKDDIEKIIYLGVGDKKCFSTNPHEFLEHQKIGGTDIAVNLNLTKMEIVKLCKDIISFYGYKENDFIIETT
jgi:predicted type IV restriction endonuclease